LRSPRAQGGNRKGAAESAVRYVSGRWWRTTSATTPEDAHVSVDRFVAAPGRCNTGTRYGPEPTTRRSLENFSDLLVGLDRQQGLA
jgi:hypothetical protein